MEAETVLNMLDSYWYDLDFFKRKNPDGKIPEKPSESSKTPSLPTIQTKSPNPIERMSSPSTSSSSSSPNSVLFTPKLQTIFSGKVSQESTEDSRVLQKGSPLKGSLGIRRKKKGLSKSLSDLEFDELKGFMDLGFVFSEEDKDSNLASIIPGLQRLGKKLGANDHDHDDVNDNDVLTDNNGAVSRPYLSEAWQVLLEKKRRESHNQHVLNWRVPASATNSEIDMKGYLKSWAHSVASAVR